MPQFQVRFDQGSMAMKGYSAFPKPQRQWNLTIRLFSVITKTLVREILPLCRGAVNVFYSLNQLGKLRFES